MCAEDEFELEEHRIHISAGEEKRVIEEIVIVLKPNLRELRRIPGQVSTNSGT
jgi:hypothetical protein